MRAGRVSRAASRAVAQGAIQRPFASLSPHILTSEKGFPKVNIEIIETRPT